MWVHDLRDADASCGGKAIGLARLIAAGLDVPEGFVIDGGAFRAIAGDIEVGDPSTVGHAMALAAARIAEAEIPAELDREVRARTKELGGLVAVRSSATIEDGEAGAAAGVFSSRTAVPADEVWTAIRAVWTSALTPLAAAYARRRHGRIEIGVIVQEHVTGTPVTVYTRPPGDPASEELLVQRDGTLHRLARHDLPREVENQHAAVIALRAEQAIGATEGADVELVQLRKQHGFDVALHTAVVQARPIVHPTARVLVPPPPIVLAALADGRTWTWDVVHNPDPLSPAQQGLVERVERAGIAPWSLRVCAGYLYTAAKDGAPKAPGIASEAQVHARAAELEASAEQALGRDEPESLDDALARYVAFYAIWAGELSRLVAAAREAFPASTERPSAVEACLLAAARGQITIEDLERHLGCLAPAWDVAVPTFGERPGLLRDAVERAKRVAGSAPPAPTSNAPSIGDLAERDDLLFARAQRMVRRALLAKAARLGIPADDIFWLPLDDHPPDPDDARRKASAARAAAARAATWAMPLVVGGATQSPPAGAALRGVGTGPRVTGRVVRFASLASAITVGAGDVVVTRAVTPALAVLVVGCAALVSETGGLLDHGAALARELGIPCVVGCRDAWSRLHDGMIVTVDGDGGTVQSSSS